MEVAIDLLLARCQMPIKYTEAPIMNAIFWIGTLRELKWFLCKVEPMLLGKAWEWLIRSEAWSYWIRPNLMMLWLSRGSRILASMLFKRATLSLMNRVKMRWREMLKKISFRLRSNNKLNQNLTLARERRQLIKSSKKCLRCGSSGFI